jgi:hypothetical protein
LKEGERDAGHGGHGEQSGHRDDRHASVTALVGSNAQAIHRLPPGLAVIPKGPPGL